MIAATIPLHTVSALNVREHWAKRARRAKEHRGTVALVLRSLSRPGPLPVVVTLTRIAPRALDDDNLRGALKACRDGVADWLGIDDRDPRVEWRYAQERGAPKSYAVRVEARDAIARARRGETA